MTTNDQEPAFEPVVWENLTQQELDDAYDQSIYAPNRMQILHRYQSNSELTRNRLGRPRQFRYGPGTKETLDVFSPAQANAPVNIFIHGGAWRSGSAAQYAYLADLFVNAGAHLVLVDFDWVQDRDGDLLPIADQVCRAIAWTGQHASEFGADSNRLFLSGHSSGAHLAGATLATDWQHRHQLQADVVKGALLCSGMYELEPVSLSARSAYVRFTEASLEQLSPLRAIERIQTPLVIAYGDHETPEFQRQSKALYDATRKRPLQTELILASGYNHFEILETMASPYGLLGQAILRQMQLID